MIYKQTSQERIIAAPIFCRHCGAMISPLELSMKYKTKALCYSCISELTIHELLRICEFNTKEDLLYSLGFKRI